ncbi:ethyl tert-butyl ether degradation protein EthD [Sorangium cellulosum]|uniref:Ethyl tert-butyl ether degradation protein EthD n=2 Tax=Sorangium cellulosum TaxID=56 RepID=A0A2L0F856_SORCE|nr:ethyl tert-butyl ether degradation protein EthD [Sorangium cellulosum]
MVKLLAFLTRRGGMDLRDFVDYYENKHVPFICSLAPVPAVYKRSYLKRGDALNMEDGAIGFDVVTETVFPDRAALQAWLGKIFEPGTRERVVADEEKFLDRSRYWAYVVEERVTSESSASNR